MWEYLDFTVLNRLLKCTYPLIVLFAKIMHVVNLSIYIYMYIYMYKYKYIRKMIHWNTACIGRPMPHS